jgi:hypothetical protein
MAKDEELVLWLPSVLKATGLSVSAVGQGILAKLFLARAPQRKVRGARAAH